MNKLDQQLLDNAIEDWKRHNSTPEQEATQGDLALKCGIRPSHFSEIIHDKRYAGIINLCRMAAQLEGHICFRELGRLLHPKLYQLRPDIFEKKEGENDMQ